mgnify:CR=1 FL=1
MTTTALSLDESVSASDQVVKSIAEKDGTDPLDLPPLYESVDPDALDALFTPDSREPVLGKATFTHAGYEVTVAYDGEVVITASPE